MHAPTPATRSPLWIALGIALALMIGVVAAYLLGAFGLGPQGDAAEAARGEGLFSGTLNPILSFLSLIALLITLQLQRTQMRMQRQELDNSRAELEVTRTELASAQSRSALALAEQSGFLARQTFENTLFQLIRLHHQVVDGIDFRTGEAVTTKGRDCFRIYYTRRLRNAYQAVLEDETGPRDAQGRARAAYEAFYARNGHEVGHYFTNLFRIYKFIDGSPSGDAPRTPTRHASGGVSSTPIMARQLRASISPAASSMVRSPIPACIVAPITDPVPAGAT